MRLFIAIELNREIRDELAKIQSELKTAGADVKWVEGENIHLTLKFLGEVQEDRIKEITDIMDEVAKNSRSFELTVKGVGAFPKPEFPRVIWAGTEKGKIESEGIAKTLEERLETAGFEREERPFKAHLTIGRVRSPKNKGPLKERLLAATIDKPLSQKVDSVILFKSELKPAGPVYTKVHESKLT